MKNIFIRAKEIFLHAGLHMRSFLTLNDLVKLNYLINTNLMITSKPRMSQFNCLE